MVGVYSGHGAWHTLGGFLHEAPWTGLDGAADDDDWLADTHKADGDQQEG